MSFEILFPFGLWVFEPGWLLDHSQQFWTCGCCVRVLVCLSVCLISTSHQPERPLSCAPLEMETSYHGLHKVQKDEAARPPQHPFFFFCYHKAAGKSVARVIRSRDNV